MGTLRFKTPRSLAASPKAVALIITLTSRAAFAGDHQHRAQAAAVATHQKAPQREVRFGLAHAVQVDTAVDLDER